MWLTFALSKTAPHAHAVVSVFERANVTTTATNLAQVAGAGVQELADSDPSANLKLVESEDVSGIWDPSPA